MKKLNNMKLDNLKLNGLKLNNLKLADDGLQPVVNFGVFTVLAAAFGWCWISAVLFVCFAFLVWFYRDPDRVFPEGENVFASPADGKVIEIMPYEHPFTGAATKIGIFMSPVSVHVNRAPCEGTVEYLEYVPGKKAVTLAPKASEENERNCVGLRTKHGPVLIVQIAGLLARRIVCRVKCGDVLSAGERYGMIKFGSKVDVHLPSAAKLSVKVGDKVFAGETILGVMEE